VAQYVFDGDGQRVQAVVGGVTTTYVGAHYEQETDGTTVTVRVAMRQNGEVSYLLGDHLGGTNLTLDATGNKVAGLRYRAWGETRYGQPTATPGSVRPARLGCISTMPGGMTLV